MLILRLARLPPKGREASLRLARRGIPGMNKGAVDALAEATNATSAQPVPMIDDRSEEEDAGSLLQDNELDGGPCRGRTYGPLIKSERQGMTQVFEDLGHPLVIPANYTSCRRALPVSL